MKAVVIIHGIQGKAGENWMGWLKDNLEKRDFNVLMPQMPNTEHPDRLEWFSTLKNLIKDTPLSEVIFVGHSLGVTTILDFLELQNQKARMLVSVAGFSEDYGLELNSYFLQEKTIDLEKVKNHLAKTFVILGDDDPYVTQDALHQLAEKLEVEPIVIEKGGHFNAKAGYTSFPLLLKIILDSEGSDE